MKMLFAISLLILSTSSKADGESLNLHCREISPDEEAVILTGDKVKFNIEAPHRGCESSFEYEHWKHGDERYLITSWPSSDELGVNAQRHLYSASSSNSGAKYIGAVPVEAAVIDEGKYRSVSQVGGAIYETIYFIHNDTVSIERPSKELIISDTKCIYTRENDEGCLDVTGTFEKPVCTYNDDGKNILIDISECSGLLQFE